MIKSKLEIIMNIPGRLWCVLLFLCLTFSAYAFFDKNFPHVDDKNTRIISDSNDLGAIIKREKKNNKFLYELKTVSFVNKETIKNISFEDTVSYDICYVPEKGDYFLLATGPLFPATIIAINVKSGNIIRCSLHEIFKKRGIYEEISMTWSGNHIDVNFWHQNTWRTLNEHLVMLPCDYKKRGVIFSLMIRPAEGVICLIPDKEEIRFKPYPSLKVDSK